MLKPHWAETLSLRNATKHSSLFEIKELQPLQPNSSAIVAGYFQYVLRSIQSGHRLLKGGVLPKPN